MLRSLGFADVESAEASAVEVSRASAAMGGRARVRALRVLGIGRERSRVWCVA